MAYKCREEIVGKRFLSVSGYTKLKLGKISEWCWRAGVIRAATHKDNANQDLQVLVEYDEVEWHRREWISVYKDGLFHLFLVEQGLCWSERTDPFTSSQTTVLWPTLTFSSLVSTTEYTSSQIQPVEFLLDKELSFKDYKQLKPFQDWDPTLTGVKDYPDLRITARRWREQQDGQQILLTTPSVLVGYRVEVYRAEGTTQWYTAVIIGYNEATKDLTLTDDTVLEEHSEDPALVQMRLIGDGVVESIMRGENVGITPRRSRSAVLQTHHQQLTRVVRGIAGVNTHSTTGVTNRKGRSVKPSLLNDSTLDCTSPELAEKGSISKAVRKRKVNENESASTRTRNNCFSNSKEDLENKQVRKKNTCNRNVSKKKVLEEANNSKLREVEIRIEDCLQNSSQQNDVLAALRKRNFKETSQEVEDHQEKSEVSVCAEKLSCKSDVRGDCENDSTLDDTSNSSSVQLVQEVKSGDNEHACASLPLSEVVASEIASEEDDCVIVAQRTSSKIDERDCSSRGDDDGPLSSSSPFNRMELAESSNATLLRFPDDRSDSGVSSLRSGSGDERSGSRSSALSSSDEPQSTAQVLPTNRSPLLVSASHHPYNTPVSATSEPVRVWRDHSLILESEPYVRHIHSVQHQSLLMSHPSTPAASGPPPTSAANHPASLYPSVAPPPNLMSPHPLQPLPPSALYPHHIPEMLWKQQRYPMPVGAHLLPPQTTDELMERERAYTQDRLLRERQNKEAREMEKQHKEMEHKERLERERQERDKLERERDKEKEQERDRQEKQKAAQAVHKHFEESLRRAGHHNLNKDQGTWNLISLPPPSRTSNTSEEERKRMDKEHHQRQLSMRPDSRDHRYYQSNQRAPSGPSKPEYPPPAHSRVSTNKLTDKLVHSSSSKAEVNAYGYPAYQPHNAFFSHEPKSKNDHHKQSLQSSSLVVTKSNMIDREREALPNPPPLMNPKGSMSHSQSPKLRSADMLAHYMPPTASQPHKSGLYEYRSSNQSPHHLSHSASPHHHMEPQNLGKGSHQRPSPNQMSSPHHQRQSPHPHMQPHQSPELHYRNVSVSDAQAMIYPTSSKGHIASGFSYLPTTTTSAHHSIAAGNGSSNAKLKVSSPAPHHIYGKPSAGISSGMPVLRAHETAPPSNPIPLTSKTLSASVSPSPFQQMSQYHPPHQQQPTSMSNCPPPPAHSTRTTMESRTQMYDRMYPVGTVAGGLSVKPSISHHGTSPPTAASAPSPVSRPQVQYCMPGVNHTSPNVLGNLAVQTQPLDLGVSSSKYDMGNSPKRKSSNMNASNPICLEVKKRRVEPVGIQTHNLPVYVGNSQPQLARVSEPSPLIASAATTITTVVNTAAYRPPPTVTLLTTQSNSNFTESLSDVSVTAVTVASESKSNSSSDSPLSTVTSIAPTAGSPAPMNPQPADSPNTPIKSSTITPSVIDSEKSNSPGPPKLSNYPVRHLKKAWLQRHTGEDSEDTTGVIGSGSCVTLPLNINNSQAKESPITSLHNIGSMAVNSINKTKSFSSKANNRKVAHKDVTSLNGHPADSNKGGDDSSSSDQDRGRKSPPKRKPPKVKRKKGGGAPKKAPDEHKKRKTNQSVTVSESGSDSDKESGSEKDSDSGASTTLTNAKKTVNNSLASKDKEPRKRGRRPKTSKNDKGEEPRPKKSKDEPLVPPRDPFRKPPVGQLKKTGESFLQDGPCFEVAPKLAKCRECRWTPNQRSKNMPNIFCRFYAFRRLRYTKNGQLAIAGFSDPHKDASEDDLKLWVPSAEVPPSDLDLETSRFLLKQVGDHFCDLLVQEKEAHSEHMSDDKVIAWKRVVQGVREMCDVCETTLFNFHWACGKCGFVVCLDCYKGRKNGTVKIWGEPSQKDRDDFSWLLCTNRQAHEQEKLMLTQIIAGDSLLKLGKLVHEMRELWGIEQFCGCGMIKEISQKCNGARKEIIKSIMMSETNGIKKEIKEEFDIKSLVNGSSIKDEKTSSLNWLADLALTSEDGKDVDSDSGNEEKTSTLRDLLTQKNITQSPITNNTISKPTKKTVRLDTLDDVISSVIEDSVHKSDLGMETKSEMKHFIRRHNWQTKGRRPLPIRIMTLTDGKEMYPDVPHSWLCDGKLLRLSDAIHINNYKIFQDQWKRGQPVLVSDLTRLLDKDLWNPDAFARDFGDEKNDLVNCMNGNLVPNQPMKKFWEGFEHFSKRLKDERGNPMLLKLKDWPPGEDFAEMLPTRFNDLMKVLPLSQYTHRTGKLNLASRLPDCFVRPDLGPKMYNAYGSALHPTKGTTNLHLDISDAVNVMVYVGIPKDSDSEEHIKEAFRAIDEAGCDILTRRRVRDKGELPGALWHIYNARDADKIRDLLNKIVVEKGGRLEPHHDPIHDQSCYLDETLRKRLYKEYGVEGYAIVQCLGDAVFIPAGAPHQVRNLHNCIKVAEDFVSPENVAHCFHLTQEFRDLSDTHSNHEDKLQIKNIIYHAVKDSLSCLMSVLNKHVKKEKDCSEHNGNGAGGADSVTNSNLDSSSEPA